jgi:Amidases related to nicotinamidase
MTQHCCEGTARDAAALGLHVEFLSDATGTVDLVAAVATTTEWSLAVQAGEPLTGSDILASTGHARVPEKHAELHRLMHDARAAIDGEIAAGEKHQFAHTLYVGQGAGDL